MRVTKASAKTGKVFNESGQEVTDVITTLKLQADSDGYLLIDQNLAVYIALPVEDITTLKNISSSLLDLSNLLASTAAVVGSPPSATNPEILPKITEIQQAIAGFKQT